MSSWEWISEFVSLIHQIFVLLSQGAPCQTIFSRVRDHLVISGIYCVAIFQFMQLCTYDKSCRRLKFRFKLKFLPRDVSRGYIRFTFYMSIFSLPTFAGGKRSVGILNKQSGSDTQRPKIKLRWWQNLDLFNINRSHVFNGWKARAIPLYFNNRLWSGSKITQISQICPGCKTGTKLEFGLQCYC